MIVLGRVVAPYGVRGWVKIRPFGDDPSSWGEMREWWLGGDAGSEDWRAVAVEGFRPQGSFWVAKFRGIDDRTGAEAVDGRFIGAPREALPALEKNEHYWTDLIGLAVVNGQGESLGKVDSLVETGAGHVLVVREGERERLLPFIERVVKGVYPADGLIRVEWGRDW